jgi:streptomycin 6-kinase
MRDKLFAKLPERFVQNTIDLHREKGEQWLDDLPHLIGEIRENWSLTVEKSFPNLSYHFVAPCVLRENGTRAVLKIGFPEPDSIVFSEAKMLGHFDGNGAVKLLQFDENRCSLLLERLLPGEDLTELCQKNDGQATAIATDIMRKIWDVPFKSNDFPDLEKWTASFRQAENTNFSQRHFETTREFFDELINSSEQRSLHGDLHHQNILSAEREPYLAIDPKGIIGDIGFEIAVFLNNPRGWILSHPNRRQILEKRIEQFSRAFEIEPLELRKWAYAEAILSAWWTFEDGGADWAKWLACADVWAAEGF